MKSPQNFATVVSALSCSILLCFFVNPCIGFQQPLQTLPCSLASCRSKSLHSSLSSTSKQFSRFGGRSTNEWWRNNSNEQKSNGRLMADASASAGEVKKGLFDKVRIPLILETLPSNVRLAYMVTWNTRPVPYFDNRMKMWCSLPIRVFGKLNTSFYYYFIQTNYRSNRSFHRKKNAKSCSPLP